jgi:hypothetical protein
MDALRAASLSEFDYGGALGGAWRARFDHAVGGHSGGRLVVCGVNARATDNGPRATCGVTTALRGHRVEVRSISTSWRPPRWEYVASDIGPGIAINVVFIDEGASAPYDRVYLGALGPGGERRLPDRLQQHINTDDGHFHRYRLLAEPLVGGEWCRSDNVCEHSRQMSHRVVFFEPSEELRHSVRTLSLDDLSEQAWAEIQAGRKADK